jgi:hypothetical protein
MLTYPRRFVRDSEQPRQQQQQQQAESEARALAAGLRGFDAGTYFTTGTVPILLLIVPTLLLMHLSMQRILEHEHLASGCYADVC